MHYVWIYISYVIFRDAVESGTQWNPACKLLKKYNDFGFHLAGEVEPRWNPVVPPCRTRKAPTWRPDEAKPCRESYRRYRHSRASSARDPILALYRFHPFVFRYAPTRI